MAKKAKSYENELKQMIRERTKAQVKTSYPLDKSLDRLGVFGIFDCNSKRLALNLSGFYLHLTCLFLYLYAADKFSNFLPELVRSSRIDDHSKEEHHISVPYQHAYFRRIRR